jgi:hypothetical protein
MLTLTGTVRAVVTLGGGINRKTGELIKERPVVQVEGLDNRGLVQLYTLTVPDPTKYAGMVGQQISLPVRAWTPAGVVNLAYEDKP